MARQKTAAEASTAVLEGGSGEPVVLLHGQGEFAAVWMRVVPGLARTHRVVVPDLPGHGASEVFSDAPTTLVHGRHDLQVPLRVAERASARYRWPLHVIDGAADDPAFEQPDAFLAAMRAVLGDNPIGRSHNQKGGNR